MVRPFIYPEYVTTGTKSSNEDISRQLQTIKTSLHDNIYKLQLLLLGLNRSLKHGYKFYLDPEVNEAVNFDNLIFSFDGNNGPVFRFIQVVHNKDESKKVTCDDLIEDGGDFEILKYFVSYRKISQKYAFKSDFDYVIYTNIDLHDDTLKPDIESRNSTVRLKSILEDTLLSHNNYSKSKLYEFTKDSTFYNKLKSILKQKHADILASKLAKIVTNEEKVLPQDEMFENYCGWLLDKVFKRHESYLDFKDEFVKNQCKSDEALSDFRKTFIALIEKELPRDNIYAILRKTKLKIPEKFKINANDSLSLDVSDEEIATFLDKFVLAVNQPDKGELKNIITDEIGEGMNFINNEFMADRLLEYILDWVKGKKVTFLTFKDVQPLFEGLKQNLVRLGLNKGYYFESNVQVVRAVKEILQYGTQQIVIIYSKNQLLTSIKILQAFTSATVDADVSGTEIFCDFRTLQSLVGTESCPINAFTLGTYKYLVVDNIQLEDNSNEILKTILDIPQKEIKKSVILNISYDKMETSQKMLHDILEELAINEDKCLTLEDNNNKLCNLLPQSQQKLLDESKVVFQGKEILLRLLINDNLNLIGGEVLSELISKGKFEIDTLPVDDKYEDIKDYIVERTLRRCVAIKYKTLSEDEDFFISTNKVTTFDLQPRQEIVLISKYRQKFNKLCKCNKNKTVHWLIKENVKSKKSSTSSPILIWQQSQGSLVNLRKHLDENCKFNDNFKPQEIMTSPDTVAIIAGEPGIGKSTLLAQLDTQMETHLNSDMLWVIKINLLRHIKEFSELKKLNVINVLEVILRAVKWERLGSNNKDEIEMHDFIFIDSKLKMSFKDVDVNFKAHDLLEAHLFSFFYNSGNVVVLVDEFEDIGSSLKDAVLDFIEVLKTTRIKKILLTTRPYNEQRKIEDRLGTFAYTIMPLCKDEQKIILSKFWESKLQIEINKKQKSFINKLLNMYLKESNDNCSHSLTEFVTIPQHLIMLATVYKNAFHQFCVCADFDSCYSNLEETFNLCDLNEKFLNIKLNFVYNDLTHYYIEEQKREDILEKYRYIALFALFTENDLRNLLSNELIEKVRSLIASDMTELIDRVYDGRPQFIHRTFAEYFAAVSLASMLDPKDITKDSYNSALKFVYNLWINKYTDHRVLFNILNYKLVTNYCNKTNRYVLAAALYGDHRLLAKTKNLNDIRDSYGRTFFHLACCNFEPKLFTSLLELSKNILKIRDKLFEWTPLHYAVVCLSEKDDSLDKIDIKITPFRGAVNMQDVNGKTPIMLAVQLDCHNIIKFLLKFEPDLNENNKFGHTVLHYVPSDTLFFYLTENGSNPLLIENDKEGKSLFDKYYKDNKLHMILRIIEKCLKSNKKGSHEMIECLIEKAHCNLQVQLLYHYILNYTACDTFRHLCKIINVNIQDDKGKAVLHYAAKNDESDKHNIKRLLLDLGADENLKDHLGKTAKDYEHDHRHEQALLKHPLKCDSEDDETERYYGMNVKDCTKDITIDALMYGKHDIIVSKPSTKSKTQLHDDKALLPVVSPSTTSKHSVVQQPQQDVKIETFSTGTGFKTSKENLYTKHEIIATEPEYKGSGIKTSLHRTIYQSKFLMLFLSRAIKYGYNFILATDVEEAEKFDDVVFSYDNDDKDGKVYRFLQAKHKQDGTKKIIYDDLLKETEDDFSLLKYFVSYRKIKQKTMFEGNLKDFIICTNIDLQKEVLKAVYEIDSTEDNILSLGKNSKSKQYKFLRVSAFYDKLKSILKNTHADKIATKLAKTVLNKEKTLPKDKLFKYYRGWLLDKVFKIEKDGNGTWVKFGDTFLQDEIIDDEALTYFRSAFITSMKIAIPNEDVHGILQNTKLQIPATFKTDSKYSLSLDVSNKEIDDFLDKLVLAVNQPNEDKLQSIITDEIAKDMKFCTEKLITRHIIEYALGWIKEKKGHFLTSEDGRHIFNRFRQTLENLAALSFEHKLKIQRLHSFKDNVQTINIVRDFLNHDHHQVLTIYTKSQLLTSMKILQAYSNSGNADMFCDFETFESSVGTTACPIDSFRSDACNLLVIDNITKLGDATEILKTVVKMLQQNPKKRIILIISQEDSTNDEYMLQDVIKDVKYDSEKCLTLVDNDNNFSNLTSESQRKLNDKIVIFQGKEMALSSVIGENTDRINNEILSRLMSDKKMMIGKSPIVDTYEKVKGYFIDRTLRSIVIKNDVINSSNDFYVAHDDSQVNESDFKPSQEIVLISENEVDFSNLSKQYECITIHWLKEILSGDKTNELLIWQKSQGSLKKLRNLIQTNVNINFEPHQIMASSNRVVIISAEPGMGKSILLSHLASQTETEDGKRWVVTVNLMKHINYFSELRGVENIDALKFLCWAVKNEPLTATDGSKKEWHDIFVESNGGLSFKIEAGIRFRPEDFFEAQLFKQFYNSGKVVLFIDGYDEVSPYRMNVMYLIEKLKYSKIQKIVVSTRPYNSIENELEDRFFTFAYKITGLPKTEQKTMLMKFWKSSLSENINEESTRTFIDDLLYLFGHRDYGFYEFLCIPLHVEMIATEYTNELVKYCRSDLKPNDFNLKHNFNGYDLFTNLVNRKLTLIEQGLTHYFNMTQYQEQILEKHRYFALLELFGESALRDLIPKEKYYNTTHNLIESIKEGKENSGFITRVDNGRPQFVHHGFAAYFAADLLVSMLGISDLASEFLYKVWTGEYRKRQVFLNFVNYKLITNCVHEDVLRSALNGDINAVAGKINLDKICDSYGRTLLHLACCDERLMEYMIMCEIDNSAFLVQDKLFGWSPLHYAVANYEYGCYAFKYILKRHKYGPRLRNDIVNLQDIKGKTPVMLAAERRQTHALNFLLQSKPDFSIMDNYGKTLVDYLKNLPLSKIQMKQTTEGTYRISRKYSSGHRQSDSDFSSSSSSS